jgi:hypothetical protein
MLHAVTRNLVEIKVSTTGAVGEAGEGERDSMGVKTQGARVASPRLQTHQIGNEIEDTIAA